MKDKLAELIRSTACIGEFDKYFLLTQIEKWSEDNCIQIQSAILHGEKELLSVQINSIGKIKNIVEQTYPELESSLVPEFSELFEKLKSIEENITESTIQELKLVLHNKIAESEADVRAKPYFSLILATQERILQEIAQKSSITSMQTMGQIKETVRSILADIRELDLVIESRIFNEIIKLTNTKLPQLNDRMLLAFKFLYESIETKDEDSIKMIRQTIEFIFEWDLALRQEIKEIFPDLEKYVQYKDSEKLEPFAKELIDKYGFGHASFASTFNESMNTITSEFQLLIPFINKIGPIISIFESIHNNENVDSAKVDSTLGILMFILNMMDVNTIYILDFIPNIVRAIARFIGMGELDILKEDYEKIAQLTKDHSVFKVLARLSYNIVRQKKDRVENSITGKRLWIELTQNNFWENKYFLQQFGILDLLSKYK